MEGYWQTGRGLTLYFQGGAVTILAFSGGSAFLGHKAVEARRTYPVGDKVIVTNRRFHNYLAPRADSFHCNLLLTFFSHASGPTSAQTAGTQPGAGP